jgi:hypothetical protein
MKNKKVKIKSNVAAICDGIGMPKREFIRRCLVEDVVGLDVAKRVYRGDTNLNFRTAVGISLLVLKRPVQDVFTITRV